MAGMRNAVLHGYFQIDWDEVWAVIERDLGPLESAVNEALQALIATQDH
jgi:uncharacterized protein with HEPN domain